MLKLLLALACAALYALPTGAGAVVLGNAASQALQNEAKVLVSQGRFKPALEKFIAAKNADPTASAPLSGIAHMMYLLSAAVAGENGAKARQQADLVSAEALKLDPHDPLAQEVRRLLSDEQAAPLHQPSRAASDAAVEGEKLFHAGKYTEALTHYQRSMALDPAYSGAYVFAGDCHYALKNYPEAEALFRTATQIEPLNGQAWRFLSDALALQRRFDAAQLALMNGIAAQPNQRPSWDKLALMRKGAGTPMQSLQLARKVRVGRDASTGAYVMELDPAAQADGGQGGMNGAVWTALGSVEAALRNQTGAPQLSPYQIELEAWRRALVVADGVSGQAGQTLTDPGLLRMRELAHAGQLETAVLLLLYKESYRPELEAWKAAHPNGVKKFVDMYALGP